MIYTALLRGINVGGNYRVEMAKLKDLFVKLGFYKVVTYINSGNIIFIDNTRSKEEITKLIADGIQNTFRLEIGVVVRTIDEIKAVCEIIPLTWLNGESMKTDVLYLWDEINDGDILSKIPINPDVDNIKYTSGVVIWNIDRDKYNQSKINEIIGTDLYKKMTVRNVNTTRKIFELMEELV